MKVVEIRDGFNVESLKLVGRTDPVPGPRQVVLKMKAFSVNYRDLFVIDGVGRWKPPLGRIPLSDGVGVVAAVGKGVSRVKVGTALLPFSIRIGWKADLHRRRWPTPSAAPKLMAFSPSTRFLTRPALSCASASER